MRTVALFLAAVLAAVAIGCGAGNEHEAALKARVDRFAELMSGQRYAEAWALTSERFRAGNDDDPTRWAEYIEQSGAVLKKLEVQAVELSGDGAIVQALATIQANGETVQELEQQVWTKEHGQWVFDEYMTR